MGWLVLVVVGAVFWWWSLALTLRAYQGEQMPMWSTAMKAPRRAVVLRSIGAGALVFGTGLFGAAWAQTAGIAAAVAAGILVLLVLAPYMVAIARHNRRAGIAR